jgi:transcription elongation factor GreA
MKEGFMATDRVPMTRTGFEKKRAELERMESHDMIEITKRVAEARALGDLSENAEYHAAREDQGLLQAKIDSIRDELARAAIIDLSTLPHGTVVFGCLVKIKDLATGKSSAYQLVGPGDEDYEKNKILTSSPRGKGLLGKKIGDIAEVQLPKGLYRYEILDISFPD